MCGICGFNWDDSKLISEMVNSLRNRGPDGKGKFSDGIISLGHTRLSIISGHHDDNQPLYSENEEIILVCNGEIFNYTELRQELEKKGHRFITESDNEVIIHLYEENPSLIIDRLDGQFAFALYDKVKHKLLLAKDPFGIKSLYYYRNSDENRIIFASEIKALLKFDRIERKLRKEVLLNYVKYRYNLTDDYPIKGIHTVPAGSVIEFGNISSKKSRLTKSMSSRLKISTVSQFSIPAMYKSLAKRPISSETLYKVLKAEVTRQLPDNSSGMGAKDKLVLFLSGGLDSSTLLHMLANGSKSSRDIHTITTVHSNKNGKDSRNDNGKDDGYYARRIAKEYGSTHHEVDICSDDIDLLPKVIMYTEEPVSDPSAIALNMMAEKANKLSKIVYSGEGGDEFFGGYTQDLVWKYIHLYKSMFGPIIRRTVMNPIIKTLIYHGSNALIKPVLGNISVGDREKKQLLQILHRDSQIHDYSELISVFDDKEMKDVKGQSGLSSTQQQTISLKINSESQICIYELQHKLKNQILLLSDKINMANNLECRVPLVSKSVANAAFRLPSRHKIGLFQTKLALRKAMSGRLPNYITKRKKSHFTMPLTRWYKQGNDTFYQNILSKENIRNDGLFNYNYITDIFNKVRTNKTESYRSDSSEYYLRQLWGLSTASIWYRQFILGQKVKSK